METLVLAFLSHALDLAPKAFALYASIRSTLNEADRTKLDQQVASARAASDDLNRQIEAA